MYAYARAKDLGPLEEFIGGTHLANLQSVGDRCAGRVGAGLVESGSGQGDEGPGAEGRKQEARSEGKLALLAHNKVLPGSGVSSCSRL